MMTPDQLAIFKADIAADPAFAGLPHNSDGASAVAAAYNLPAASEFYVWASDVPLTTIMGNGFDWTRVDNLSVGKGRIWEWMAQVGSINPARANVRAGILAVFDGTANVMMRQAIFGHCQRLATRIEKLLKVTGNGTTVNDQGIGPAVAGVESPIPYSDVQAAWAV